MSLVYQELTIWKLSISPTISLSYTFVIRIWAWQLDVPLLLFCRSCINLSEEYHVQVVEWNPGPGEVHKLLSIPVRRVFWRPSEYVCCKISSLSVWFRVSGLGQVTSKTIYNKITLYRCGNQILNKYQANVMSPSQPINVVSEISTVSTFIHDRPGYVFYKRLRMKSLNKINKYCLWPDCDFYTSD